MSVRVQVGRECVQALNCKLVNVRALGHAMLFMFRFCAAIERQCRLEFASEITWLRNARMVATSCAIGRDGCES